MPPPSPWKYCKNPEDYKDSNEISDRTRIYWDNWCGILKNSEQPITNSLKVGKKEFMKFFNGVKDCAPWAMQQVGLMIITMPFMNIPETNVPLMPFIMGKKLLKTLAEKGIAPLQEYLDNASIDAAKKLSAQGVDSSVINTAGVSDVVEKAAAQEVLEYSAEEAGTAAGEYSLVYLAEAAKAILVAGEFLADAMTAFIDPILDIQMTLQLVGMVLDHFDICNLDLDKEIDRSVLSDYTIKYNQAYMMKMLTSLSSNIDSFGNISFKTDWPIEYFAEKSALINVKEDFYGPLRTTYKVQYLNSLFYNSDGYPIPRTKRKGSLISREKFNLLADPKEREIVNLFTNNNTVAGNWFLKKWPYILLIFILILIIIFIIINVRKR